MRLTTVTCECYERRDVSTVTRFACPDAPSTHGYTAGAENWGTMEGPHRRCAMQERQGTNPFAVASVELGLVVLGLLLSFIAYSNHNNLSCANTSSWTTWLILIL